MRTFWPLWCPQVVIVQQVNLLLSLEIAGGTDVLNAIRDFRDRKRRGRDNVLQPRNRSYSELRSLSHQYRLDESLSQDQSKIQSVIDSASLDDTSFTSKRTNDTGQVGVQSTNQALEQIATKSLHINDFESTFGESHTVQKQQVETTEDNLPDEIETRMAQDWSKTVQSHIHLFDDENDYSTASAFVKIVGIKCKAIGSGVQWWYLTQQPDMTLHSDNCAEVDTPFGHTSIVLPLHNGYQFVRFSPHWVRCHKVPKFCKIQLWKAIGPRFWSLTDSCSDVTWDARQNWYANLSKKLSVHLCMEKECEACQRRYEGTH